MALIKARLRFTEIRGRVHLFNQVPGATSPVGTYYLSPSDKSDLVLGGLLVHDLFHHEAMGLGYDPRSEALTAFLDFKWPWYNSNYTVHNHPDIKGYLEELEAGTPREAKEQKRKLYQAGRATVKRAKTLAAKAYVKVSNQRRDFHFKLSNHLVSGYDCIVHEKLNIQAMSRSEIGTVSEPNPESARKSGLNKSILDAGWGQFLDILRFKAENAGVEVVSVNPSFTSQTCSGCGLVAKKDLNVRTHSCECGLEIDRDWNAAINILRLGQSRVEAS